MADTFNRGSTMHALKHHAWVYIFGGLLSLLLAGCAADVGKTVKVSDAELAKYGTLSATDAVAALEKRLNDAKAANMPFLSLIHISEPTRQAEISYAVFCLK